MKGRKMWGPVHVHVLEDVAFGPARQGRTGIATLHAHSYATDLSASVSALPVSLSSSPYVSTSCGQEKGGEQCDPRPPALTVAPVCPNLLLVQLGAVRFLLERLLQLCNNGRAFVIDAGETARTMRS